MSVQYGPVQAVKDFDLTLEPGETVALLGPSGSGKSSVMYAVAGFTRISAGRIILSGEDVSTPKASVPPEKRSVALVFQNYALWPHLSALENVAYPLRRAAKPKAQSLLEASHLLEKVGMTELSQRKPAELSGGEQQRVGLARALARAADIYLFDEPTAHLDSQIRESVANEIAKRRAELGAAAIYATHDSEEALAIADRVVILRSGSMVQTGTPADVYERPIDAWAARLTGPVATLNATVLEAKPGKLKVLLDEVTVIAHSASSTPTRSVELLIRPEWVRPGGEIRGTAVEVSYRGPHTDYVISTKSGHLVARAAGSPRLEVGQVGGWTIERAWAPS